MVWTDLALAELFTVPLNQVKQRLATILAAG